MRHRLRPVRSKERVLRSLPPYIFPYRTLGEYLIELHLMCGPEEGGKLNTTKHTTANG